MSAKAGLERGQNLKKQQYMVQMNASESEKDLGGHRCWVTYILNSCKFLYFLFSKKIKNIMVARQIIFSNGPK